MELQWGEERKEGVEKAIYCTVGHPSITVTSQTRICTPDSECTHSTAPDFMPRGMERRAIRVPGTRIVGMVCGGMRLGMTGTRSLGDYETPRTGSKQQRLEKKLKKLTRVTGDRFKLKWQGVKGRFNAPKPHSAFCC
jgi:hypothetical protein